MRIRNLALVSLAVAGCAVTFRDVPRDGVNESREFMLTPSRAPFAELSIDSAPVVAWRTKGVHGSVSLPVVGERITLVTTTDKFLYAIDTRSGAVLWRHRAPQAFGVGAVVSDGRVIVGTEGPEGGVRALSLYNGRVRWQIRLGDVGAPLVLHDSTVYVGTQTGTLVALRRNDGKRRWTLERIPTLAGPMLHQGVLYVPTLNDSLIAVDAATGRVRRRTPLPSATAFPPALLDDSTIVLNAGNREVVAVAVPGGTIRWRVPIQTDPAGSPVVHQDTVFAITNQCVFWTIPSRDLAAARGDSLGCLTHATPLLVRDGVVVATVDGNLMYYQRSTRTVVWTRSIGSELRQPPMLQNGQLIVAPTKGTVVSLR